MLPAPADVRALIIGIEEYTALGVDYRVPGAVAAAMSFARWLVTTRGVDSAAVELWLVPAEGTSTDRADDDPRMQAITCRRFEWDTFRRTMAAPRGTFATGTGLIVYFAGHGALSGVDSKQYLVLPEASRDQFNCIELDNWRSLFASGAWCRFQQQLWIVDACRNQWASGQYLNVDRWQVGIVKLVQRCLLCACSEGELASVMSPGGPRYTRELLALLAEDDAQPWPDFGRAFDAIFVALESTGTARQRPTVLLENWAGKRAFDAGRDCRYLIDLLDRIDWDFKRYLPYIMRAQSLAPPGFARPASLEEGLRELERLGPVDNIAPMVDFVARVADATGNAALRQWVEDPLNERQRATLAARRRNDRAFVTLSLWYASDGVQPVMHGGLDIVEAGSGVQPWPRMPAKPVAAGREIDVIGEWVQAVYDHLGLHDFDLTVELFLATDLLTHGAFDLAAIPLADGDRLTLGADCAALLRCADRYKGGRKLQALRRIAPGILARHDGMPDRLHWAVPGDDASSLLQCFAAEGQSAPVWLGFDGVPSDADALLRTAISSGLPAAVWLRAERDVLTEEQLRDRVRTLLASALEALPGALMAMRLEKDKAARTVAILLDDPGRIPEMFTRFRQPGE